MPGSSTNGVPYALPGDNVADWPATSQAVADALDDTKRGRVRRMLFQQPADVPNNASTELTGAWSPINGAGDAGNGKGLDVAAGKITATRDLWVSVLAAANFVPNGTGIRFVELSWPRGYLRQIIPGATGQTNVCTLAVPAINLESGEQLSVKLYQNSGAALSPGPVKFLLSELPA